MHTRQVPRLYPSRLASAVLVVSTGVLVVGVVLVFTADPRLGHLVTLIGVLGAICSARLNHRRR